MVTTSLRAAAPLLVLGLVLACASRSPQLTEGARTRSGTGKELEVIPVDARTGDPLSAARVDWVEPDEAVVPGLSHAKTAPRPFVLAVDEERRAAEAVRVGVAAPGYVMREVADVDVAQGVLVVEMEPAAWIGVRIGQGAADVARLTTMRLGEGTPWWSERVEGSILVGQDGLPAGRYLLMASRLQRGAAGEVGAITVGDLRSAFVTVESGGRAMVRLDFAEEVSAPGPEAVVHLDPSLPDALPELLADVGQTGIPVLGARVEPTGEARTIRVVAPAAGQFSLRFPGGARSTPFVVGDGGTEAISVERARPAEAGAWDGTIW